MIDKPVWTAANLYSATPFQQTQMDWVYASQQIALDARVKNDNLARIAEYENRYSQYAAAMDNHPELAASQVPPEPAFAMVVKVDPSGWAEEVQSTERVCPTKTYVPAKPVELGAGKIGERAFAGSDWFTCLPGDTTANGVVIPGVSKDGIAGLFQKVASPIQSSGAGSVGQVLGWYQKKG